VVRGRNTGQICLGCAPIPQDYQQNSGGRTGPAGINKSALLIFTVTNLPTTMTLALIGGFWSTSDGKRTV
jgi:hypothetical protein